MSDERSEFLRDNVLQQKLERIRRALAEGTLKVDPRVLASALLAEGVFAGESRRSLRSS